MQLDYGDLHALHAELDRLHALRKIACMWNAKHLYDIPTLDAQIRCIQHILTEYARLTAAQADCSQPVISEE